MNVHTYLLIAVAVLQLADAHFTIQTLRLGGKETNKVVKKLIGGFGRDQALIGSKLAFLAALYYWRDSVSIGALGYIVAGYVGIVAWNIKVFIKQRKLREAGLA